MGNKHQSKYVNGKAAASIYPEATIAKDGAAHLGQHDSAPHGITQADSSYGKRFRQLSDELNSCGISKYIDTPTIAIIGSQSAGKSSVLEALSEIAFPRAAGTCTRCPTEVRLFNSNQPWTCKITLRLETSIDGTPLPETLDIPFGEPLMDKGDVQRRISAAQRAILNPSKDFKVFLAGEKVAETGGEEKNEIGFSENKICLDVRGKDLIDLSIIDLPGIISNAGEGEDAASIELIKGLVRKTIEKPNCLILTTITMKDDFQNQLAVTLAQEADNKGVRTLGVLTKADAVEKGDYDAWFNILEGKSNRLFHGYYAVKNPSSKELKEGISYGEARDSEKAFFRQEPWKSLSAQAVKRLGSHQLGRRLEVLLEKLIQDKLPQTIIAIRSLSEETNARLDKLPREINENQSVRHLYEICESLCKHIESVVINKGSEKEPHLLGWPLKLLSARFMAKIRRASPKVWPFSRHDGELSSAPKLTIDHEDNLTEIEKENVIPADQRESVSQAMKAANIVKLAQVGTAQELQLDMDMINDALCSGAEETLPGNTALRIKEGLILQSIKPFRIIAQELFQDCFTLLRHVASTIVESELGDRFDSPLQANVAKAVNKLIAKKAEACAMSIDGKIDREMSLVFTLNHHYYLDKRDIWFGRLCQTRIEQGLHGSATVANPFQSFSNTQYGASLAPTLVRFLKENNIIKEDLSEVARHRIPHDVKEKLLLGAEVMAYWQVAFKRFVDDIRSMITADLYRPVAEGCFAFVREQLGILSMTAEQASVLLRHPDNICAERDALQLQKQRLDRALEIIEGFSQTSIAV